MKIRNIILVVAALLLVAGALSSCAGTGRGGTEYGEAVYEPTHATGFTIYATDGASTVLTVDNPWRGGKERSGGVKGDVGSGSTERSGETENSGGGNGRVAGDSLTDGPESRRAVTELFISRGGELPPEGFKGDVVRAPLGRVVCLSSTYIAFIDAIGETDAIRGVSGARYITNEVVAQGFARGQVRDVGYDSNLNYELLASLSPDIVFIYGVGGEDTALTDKLRELGIPLTYIGDYLEQSPLGKAEWIVPFGELFDKRARAEEIFGGISARYDSLRTVARGFDVRPRVMINAPYRDVWFTPGGGSYMAALIDDAGGEYAFAAQEGPESRPIGIEAAYVAVEGADVWLNPGQANSLLELAAENRRFTAVGPVLAGRVYNCNKRRTPGGGSDFWESGALRADRVLEDVITCLHPEYGPEEDMYYFERLR